MGCKKYRIGVFFDGTGNNKFIEANQGKGGETNIAKLYALYEELKGEACGGKKCYSDKVYIEGIGTHTVEENGKRVKDRHPWDEKLEKGAGGGGGARIDDAINQVKEFLKAHPYGKGDSNKYCERIIDVFGFSRGSAQARDFINTFYLNEYFKYEGIKFGFVGIYDTVGSFGSAGDITNMKPIDPSKHDESDGLTFANHEGTVDESTREHLRNFSDYRKAKAFVLQERAKRDKSWVVELESPEDAVIGFPSYTVSAVRKAFTEYNFDLADGSAHRIFHIVSNDEVRKNFPLSSLLSIGAKHQEAAFPGVHADVGGGYKDEITEPHSYLTSPHYHSVSSVLEAVKAEQARLSEGWVVKMKTVSSGGGGRGVHYRVKCTLARNVTNSISRVTLHHMYDEASCAAVPFKPMPNDEAHAIIPEMKAYYGLYRTNPSIFNKSGYNKIKKFGKVTEGVNWEELEDTYRHHSAVDPKEASTHYDGDRSFNHIFTQDSPDMIGGNNARYVGGKVKRDIYPNKTENAILPKNT